MNEFSDFDGDYPADIQRRCDPMIVARVRVYNQCESAFPAKGTSRVSPFGMSRKQRLKPRSPALPLLRLPPHLVRGLRRDQALGLARHFLVLVQNQSGWRREAVEKLRPNFPTSLADFHRTLTDEEYSEDEAKKLILLAYRFSL